MNDTNLIKTTVTTDMGHKKTLRLTGAQIVQINRLINGFEKDNFNEFTEGELEIENDD